MPTFIDCMLLKNVSDAFAFLTTVCSALVKSAMKKRPTQTYYSPANRFVCQQHRNEIMRDLPYTVNTFLTLFLLLLQYCLFLSRRKYF